MTQKINANPVIYPVGPAREMASGDDAEFSAARVFGLHIHAQQRFDERFDSKYQRSRTPGTFDKSAKPYRIQLTLEQLNVVQEAHVDADDTKSRIRVEFTPTIPHCSMATLIGLSIRVKLLRSLPSRFKVDVAIRSGTHQSEEAGAIF
jgi:hypothetical protein